MDTASRAAAVARQIAMDVDRTAILMLCDGRARAGWRVVIAWADGPLTHGVALMAGVVADVPPECDAFEVARDAVAPRPIRRVDVIRPGDILAAA